MKMSGMAKLNVVIWTVVGILQMYNPSKIVSFLTTSVILIMIFEKEKYLRESKKSIKEKMNGGKK